VGFFCAVSHGVITVTLRSSADRMEWSVVLLESGMNTPLFLASRVLDLSQI
jgi:hypothetical protein